jgi:hypothetical protein
LSQFSGLRFRCRAYTLHLVTLANLPFRIILLGVIVLPGG